MCNPVTGFNPAALLFRDTFHGYEYEVTCNPMAVRCGYVRVPFGHPWHGLEAWDVPAGAHGGINYAEPDVICGKPGGNDNAWWFGFDCGHISIDRPDPRLPAWDDVYAHLEEILGPADPFGRPRRVRSTSYVIRECRYLIRQAEAAAQRREITAGQGHADRADVDAPEFRAVVRDETEPVA